MIGIADEVAEGYKARRKAAIASYLDRDPEAARRWRAHQWMVENASAEQIAAAVKFAADSVAAMSEERLAAELEEHNRLRAMEGVPGAAMDEIKEVLLAGHIHVGLMVSFSNGTEN
jgi:hypothetical protein